MAPRIQLQAALEEILGSSNVYFNPPVNVGMAYPCITYKRDLSNTQFANNGPYRRTKRYLLTVIDKDPDSPIPDKVAELPLCTHVRFYTAGQLNHDVFDIFY